MMSNAGFSLLEANLGAYGYSMTAGASASITQVFELISPRAPLFGGRRSHAQLEIALSLHSQQ
jgi:hypothetical protein